MSSTEKDQGKYLRREPTEDIHVNEGQLDNYGEAAGMSMGHSVYGNPKWYISKLLKKHIEESKRTADESTEA